VSLGSFPIALIVPPINLLSLSIAGLALSQRWRRAGRMLMTVGLGGLFVLALPLTGESLIASLERNLPLRTPTVDPPGAIVILSAEVRRSAGRNPDIGPGPLTLERERAGAALYRRIDLPILVTGGSLRRGEAPVARVMAQSLAEDFRVPVRWIEPEARDTWESAEDSAAILKANGIRSIYLVTHAWHMRRAIIGFEHFGISVIAAPVRIDRPPMLRLSEFIPSAGGWMMSYYALHEWIGYAYYALRW
jgi:uncharacterized SAM-binding protein YcdF (DUF218 family)